jgi:diguanylate cyclase (GGDEF)-like protein
VDVLKERRGKAVALLRPYLPALVVAGAVLVTLWSAGAVIAAVRTQHADSRLRHAVDVAGVTLDERSVDADRLASRLASSIGVQAALSRRDARALAQVAARNNDVAFFVDGRRIAGTLPQAALTRAIDVSAGGQVIGRVVAAAAVDRSFFVDVRGRSGLEGGDRLLATVGGRVAAGPYLGATLHGPSEPRTVTVGGQRFRAVSAPLVAGPAPVQIVALARPSRNPVAAHLLWLVALAAAAAGVAALALRGGRGMRTRGHGALAPADATVRDAIALVGDTLAATHNPDALLPVILEAAIEATGAVGGELREQGETRVTKGRTGKSRAALKLDLSSDGRQMTLLLWPREGGFSSEAREAAEWFSGQAVIALENARLHRIVQRQAVTDELTQLANRRHFLSTLSTEISRADRFDSPLTLVLADLDDFKRVNDRFGHQVGDVVLSEFAGILRKEVRDIDLPVRLGGEEFAVLLPETELKGGVLLADRLRGSLERLQIPTTAGVSVQVTASFGVACYPSSGSAEELLVEADGCLYRAKELGKNTVVASPRERHAASG